jgi:superfamily II DNA or RNA helicase
MGEDSPSGKRWRTWAAAQAMVLLDEADKASAPTWRGILANTSRSTWRAGFSGTFGRDLYHDLVYEELMGPVLHTVKNNELVERGISARPTIEVYAVDVTAAFPRTVFPRDWFGRDPAARRRFAYERGLVYNADRHARIAALCRPGVPTAIIVNRIDHGQALAAAIPGSVFLEGARTASERQAALEAFERGDVSTLVVTKILDRGTNRLGHAEDIVFASGEGSATQVLQRIGRGLRRGGGKATLRLVDVVDRIATEGRDKRYENVAGFFAAAARRRLTVYANEGFTVVPVRSI